MPRIRTIKPEFWTDEKIVELDPWARLLFIGLWNFCDDQGYIEYSPKRIKMQIFPGDTTDVSPLLASLIEAGLLAEYQSPIGHVLHIQSWAKHQRVSNAANPRFDPSELELIGRSDEPPPEPSRALASPPSGIEGKGREEEEERKGTSAAASVGNQLRAPTREQPPPGSGPAGRAEALLAEWRSRQRRPVGSIVAAVGMWVIDAVQNDGATDDEVRETLRRWDAKRDKGPGLLPSIFNDVANAPLPSNVLALPASRASPSTSDLRAQQAIDAGAAVQAMIDRRTAP
jgi:hypothetical protein